MNLQLVLIPMGIIVSSNKSSKEGSHNTNVERRNHLAFMLSNLNAAPLLKSNNMGFALTEKGAVCF